MTRPALASGAIKLRTDGRVEVATPPDPWTGAGSLVLGPLEFVHAVVTQIPDARKHLVRYYGAYSHRSRGRRREAQAAAPEMEALAWITDAAVIDRILAYRRQAGLESPFDARGPPAPA